jgi:hypothetical protein
VGLLCQLLYRRKLTLALFFFPTDTTHHDHRSTSTMETSINSHPASMTRRKRNKSSDPVLDNTRYNARQQSNSKRTLACDAECHLAPGLTHPSSVGQAGQDGSGVGRLISHDSIDAGARGTNHDPKIEFSGETKEGDQSLTKPHGSSVTRRLPKKNEMHGGES